jgi:hypothetical protein
MDSDAGISSRLMMTEFSECLIKFVEPVICTVHSAIEVEIHLQNGIDVRDFIVIFKSFWDFEVVLALGFCVKVRSNEVNQPEIKAIGSYNREEHPNGVIPDDRSK